MNIIACFSCILFLAAITAFGIVGLISTLDKIRKYKTQISFKAGLDLAELPVATFLIGDKKVNFLLDTGSNNSIIDTNILKDLPHQKTGKTTHIVGVGGKSGESYGCKVIIGYKDLKFEEEFNATNLGEVFGTIKADTGVSIHGILGNKFFEKYKYILDFKDLIAYK